MTDIRELRHPNDWREGDLAFCIDGGSRVSKGNILKVTGHSGGTLRFDSGRGTGAVWHGSRRFARVLTRDEMKAMPNSAELYVVTSALNGTHPVGHSFIKARHSNCNRPGYLYALKSLPAPEHKFKEGDWVRYDKLDQPTRQVRKRLAGGVYITEYSGAIDPRKLTPLTEAEAQRLLALKDIEDAREKLADAERRLMEVDGLHD